MLQSCGIIEELSLKETCRNHILFCFGENTSVKVKMTCDNSDSQTPKQKKNNGIDNNQLQ